MTTKITKVEVTRTLNTKEVYPGISCFEYIQTCVPEIQGVDIRFEGMMHTKNITKTPKSPTSKLNLLLVSQDYMDYIKTRGYGWANVPKNVDTLHTNKPYTDLGEYYNIVVKPDYSSHMLFDPEGVPYPAAIHFNYIDAQMDNEHYDLESAATWLNTRTDIITVNKLGENIQSELRVSDIPYYNAEPSRDKYLNFIWSATREDYISVWNECLAMGGKYPSCNRHQAIKRLDILGLEQFKKKETVYK